MLPVSDSQRQSVDKSAEKQPPTNKQVAALLDEAWRLRDQMEQPFTAAPMSPIDYAPHLWRAYQELLLGYDRRARSGVEYDPAVLADDLRTNAMPLASLLAEKPLPPVVGRSTILGRLADAQRRFRDQLQADRFDQLVKDPRVGRFLQFMRMKNTFVFRATDYVRWYAAAAPLLSQRHRLYQPIADYLAELGVFVDILQSASGHPDQVEQSLDNLNQQAQTIEHLRKAIEEDGLYKDAADLIDAANKTPAKPGLAGPIDSLLATPLLRAALRAKLIQARSKLEQPLAAEEPSADHSPQLPSVVRWSRRLQDQAVLDGRLAGLFDPSVRLPSPKPGEADSAATLLAKYRALGSSLGDLYRHLPQKINEDLQLSHPAVAMVWPMVARR